MSEEQINQFQGDLKAFFSVLPNRFNAENLKGVIAKHRETWYAISTIKKDKRYAEYIDRVSDEEMAGGIHMDATLDYMIAEGEVRGEARGEIRGAEKVNRLGILLSQSGRTNDFLKSLSDKGLQKKLFVEFGLEDGK